MDDQDHERLADQLEQEADKLARENARLEDKINTVRSDWHTKQQDPGVPGAIAPDGEQP